MPFDTKLTSPRHRLCCATRRGKKFAALCKKAEEMKALKQVRQGRGGYQATPYIPLLSDAIAASWLLYDNAV